MLCLLSGVMISFIPPLLIRRYLFYRLAQKDSTEKLVRKMKILGVYVQAVISFVGATVILFSVLLIVAKVKQFHPSIVVPAQWSTFIGIIFFWLTIAALYVYNRFIYYDLYKQIQLIEATKREALRMDMKYIFYITIIPVAVQLIYFIPFIQQLRQQDELMRFVIWGTVLFGISIFHPYIIKIIFRAIPLQDEKLRQELMTELQRHQLKGIKIYQISTSKFKYANAGVCGIPAKKIFIMDYCMKHLTTEEVRGIFVHEIAHIKKFHLEIKIALGVLSYLVILFSVSQLNRWKQWLSIQHIDAGIAHFWITLAMVSIPLVLVYVNRWISRLQELQADRYAIQSGMDVDIYISMLHKLMELNYEQKEPHKLIRAFRTHPSFQKSIEAVRQCASQYNVAIKNKGL